MPLTAVLVGPPASGKSAAAHLVSAALGVPLAETDDAVAQVAGMPIHDYFVATEGTGGEAEDLDAADDESGLHAAQIRLRPLLAEGVPRREAVRRSMGEVGSATGGERVWPDV